MSLSQPTTHIMLIIVCFVFPGKCEGMRSLDEVEENQHNQRHTTRNPTNNDICRQQKTLTASRGLDV